MCYSHFEWGRHIFRNENVIENSHDRASALFSENVDKYVDNIQKTVYLSKYALMFC